MEEPEEEEPAEIKRCGTEEETWERYVQMCQQDIANVGIPSEPDDDFVGYPESGTEEDLWTWYVHCIKSILKRMRSPSEIALMAKMEEDAARDWPSQRFALETASESSESSSMSGKASEEEVLRDMSLRSLQQLLPAEEVVETTKMEVKIHEDIGKARLSKYRYETFYKNALMAISFRRGRHFDLIDLVRKNMWKNKKAVCDAPYKPQDIVDIEKEFGLGMPAALILEVLRRSVEEVLPPPYLLEWKRNINKKLKRPLRVKFQQTFFNVTDEVQGVYSETLVVKDVLSKLSLPAGYGPPPYCEKGYMNGRSKKYARFVKLVRYLPTVIFTVHPIIRNIVESAMDLIPTFIIDLSTYRDLGFIPVYKLKALIEKDAKRVENILLQKWYPSITEMLSRKDALKNVQLSYWPRFISCASNIMKQQITGLKIVTLEHLIKVLSDDNTLPLIQMNLMYILHEVEVSPSLTEFIDVFHFAIDNIIQVASRLTSLEILVNIPSENLWIPTDIPGNVVTEYKNRTREVAKRHFQEILDYKSYIEGTFSELYDPELIVEMKEFVSQADVYEVLEERVEYFYEFRSVIQDRVANIYFPFARLCQTDFLTNMNLFVNIYLKKLGTAMLEMHRKKLLSICAIFEEVEYKCLKMPSSSEELMALGQYVLWVRKVMISGLRERILDNTMKLAFIMEFKNVPEEHLELNAKTIMWLTDIHDVFEQNSVMFEQRKFEFEEALTERSQRLIYAVLDVFPMLAKLNYMIDIDYIDDYILDISVFLRKLEYFEKEVEWIRYEEDVFKMGHSTYNDLDEMKAIVIPFAEMLHVIHRWSIIRKVYLYGSFIDLVYDDVQETVDYFYRTVSQIDKTYKRVLRQQLEDEYPRRLAGNVDDPEKLPAPTKLCEAVMTQIKQFRPFLPYVEFLCNPALTQRHWDEMSNLVGFDMTPDTGTTLQKILDMQLSEFMEQFEVISVGAIKELALQILLAKMKEEWSNMEFPLGPFKNTGITIVSSLADIQALLDDHILKTLTMRGSVFVKPIEREVLEWYNKLMRVNQTVDVQGKVQVQWLYLLPIFSSEDIVKQMPTEGQLFQRVDTCYRRLMSTIIANPIVMESAATEGVLETLLECIQMLEDINNGVNNYLEKKRLFFARFFFLSNDEMLEILSETSDPLRVQPHLKKCFEGIAKLQFDEDKNILALFSGEGEKVDLVEFISTKAARGSVEKWLVQVEQQMITSVRYQIEISHVDYAECPRVEWVKKWPGQVVLCVSQIYWTVDVHTCLHTHNPYELHHYVEVLLSQINDVVELVRGKLSKMTRVTLGALVVLDVHAKDVVADLFDKGVCDDGDFQWLAQLRYYWEEDNVLLRCTNAPVKYAYEYLGNTPRLVITPLTDRCYRTLLGAYYLHLNGAPEGPAGTGKTETTKDLAKALAVQCVVFNCSDGLDYIAMGKFFKGLASSGAWACFDEFNRIELEVLSVIAQQILSIVQAVQGGVETFMFEGTEIRLNPACYVCITMNPGYAGRSELPDNLKVLFRTVAMMVPDYALIGEISLYSYGFVNARVLSVKIVTTYRLCSEQLSSQNHYDYGMRAVKSVLAAAGNLKLQFPNEEEDILLLRSIIDVNLPKFLSHDVPLFEGIMSDLFYGVVLPQPDYVNFINAIKKTTKSLNLQPVDFLVLKIIQTYEMMIVRHGFMLVGDPFGGKTSTLKTLAGALGEMCDQGLDEQHVRYRIINPKSITMGQLYGQFDPVSYEWSDGVVASTFRKYAYAETPERKWVIFDGPVDAVWIENMNTVLDDNKKLCLTSGDIIQLTPEMSMIFEVMDLAQASPATVSRCGMVYFEAALIGWQPFVTSWLQLGDPRWAVDQYDLVYGLCMWLFPPSLLFIKKHGLQLVSAGEINSVRSSLNIIQMLITEAMNNNSEEDLELHMVPWLQAAFMYGVVWGIAGILDAQTREQFDVFYKDIWRGVYEEYPFPECMESVDIPIPSKGLVHDFMYTFRGKGVWVYWPDYTKTLETKECINMQQTLVPTVDTERYQYVMDLHMRHQVPMLLVGDTGTGKSFYFQNMLMYRLSQDDFVPAFIAFTAQTSANQTQELIISKLNKKRKGIYVPPEEKKCIIFVDNVNMPAKEIYGAQPPIELLRQYFDNKHWYDLKDTTKIFLHDILVVAAMGPPGGSRQEIYARFLRHFNIYSINPFSEESMQKIFSTVLLIGLKRHGFTGEVMSSIQSIVQATLVIYNAAISDLLPIPAKSHYVFNLRDFARVILGCSLVWKDASDSKVVFVRLWVHEVMRVFADRLIDDDDKAWFFQKISAAVRNQFNEDFDMSLEPYKSENGKVTMEGLSKLMFGNFLDPDALEEEKKYEEIPSLEKLKEISEAAMDEYNGTHKTKMDIVLFRFALEHLSRICRVVSSPCGSALLVGVGGSGRQSLTRLATTITGNEFFQPEITKTYNLSDWRDDIKGVLKLSGGKNLNTTFLFTEAQIKEEVFLQDIDSLLNSGEVPNIFPIDERQEVLEMVRLAAQGGNRNLDISPLAVFSFFITRCKEKLHMVLCFSPIGASFRPRLRLYPALVNCCTIDWFEGWPEQALEMVAQRYMTGVNLDQDVINSCMGCCKYFHVQARELSTKYFLEAGRKTYMTSSAYLELIRLFTDLTNQKQNELSEAKQRYVNGLDKLQFAADQVAQLQKSLSALKPQLEVAAKDTVQMMQMIEKETKQVQKASDQVKKDEEMANVQAASAQALKVECEADLAEAIPILEEALVALDTLKPSDITLVKSMKNPPGAVKLVMAAVCVMRDVKPDRVNDPSTGRKILDFWGPSKKLLGDMYFLQHLKEYDKDNIPAAIMKRIRTEFIPNKDFRPQVVAKASSAAEGLCKWILAMDKYDKVAKIVAPKKEKLEAAEREYNATMALLEEKRAQVRALEEKLNNLNIKLEDTTLKKMQLEGDVDLLSNKLIRAEKLIGGLGGERERWSKAADGLQNNYDSLAGDILLSCGIIAYLAAFSMTYRQVCLDDWKSYVASHQIPMSRDYTLRSVLGDDLKIQNWNIAGLPRDAFSTDNGIITDTSRRSSLMVDPQGQANKWIKTMEAKNLKVIKLTNPDYMKIIAFCIERGFPVLLENILEELETPLEPVLCRQIFKQGGIFLISLGENLVEYDHNFRFYMTSKLRNPHYLPEVFNKVTVVNFALTPDGLEDQLLGIVVAKERPDLEKNRQDLIVQSAANRAGLKMAEDNILRTLSQTTGNILENEEAIQVLDSSKLLSQDIMKKQVVAKQTQEEIEEFRLDYRPIASHSSILYYCVTDLPNVDPMYHFSLGWFINLYIMSIEKCHSSNILNERLEALKDTFTYNLYNNVCRSLFEKDKLLFSFILCTNILIFRKKVKHVELSFFLTGGVGLENTIANPAPDWLADKAWDGICRVKDLPGFKGFMDSFRRAIREWKSFNDIPEPDYRSLPKPWSDQLGDFQKLTVARIMRPDKVLLFVRKFVRDMIGGKYVLPPPFDIERSFEDSDCLCPLLFILSPGADPMAALLAFANRTGFGSKFQAISLGQGQGPIAEALIERARADGDWVCLQNCHLAVSWMPSLEKVWESMDKITTSPTFRLWLTSYPSTSFPVSILQYGVKMTNEPPTGLQQNLMRSYLSEPLKDPAFFDGCPERDKEFSKLLFALGFFHAVVQERRKFGPIGWNIPYGFNESDFHISVRQLQMFMNESAVIPYQAITYLTGECNYGGRVTDDWDRRTLITILADFINSEVIENPEYMFSTAGPEYVVPSRTKYAECLAHIESIPNLPSPEVFGLHKNAGIIRDLQESKLFIDTMILVQGEGTSGEGEDTASLLEEIVVDILSKIPKPYDLELAQSKYPVVYEESMNTVLVQEMERFNRLLRVIVTSLHNVNKAVKGLVVMSPDLEAVAANLVLSKVPGAWNSASYPSLKPLGSYVTDFMERMAFLQSWYEKGKPPCFWISGFYFTQAFLTGAMQNYARKYCISINLLTYDFEILAVDRMRTAPVDGVYIYGLFLDGAKWDRNSGYLTEQLPKVLRDIVPLVWIKPLERVQLVEGTRYKCPLYKTSERRGVLSTTGHSTNYVLPILLDTKKPPSHWIKRGTALLLQLDD